MDFTFTEEQDLIRASVASFLADTYDFEKRKAALASEAGWRPEIWRALAQDLGVLGAAFPEDLGGMGGGPVDTMIVAQELGRALVVEPYLETVVLAAGLLKRFDSEVALTAVRQIISGDVIAVLAWGEPTSRFDPSDVSTTAKRDGAGWRLDGAKAVVVGAPWASKLIVSARTSGDRRSPDEISLFLVDKSAPGVSLIDYPTVDGKRASEVMLDNVKLGADALLGAEGQGLPALEAALDDARAALCAEALGVLSEMVRQTVEYAKQRKQFGRPIAEFQVLQHRLVDMFVQAEQATSMAYMATLKLGLPPRERANAVSAAKVFIGRALTFVGQAAVQTHGGIGLTEELALSHYFKRASMIEKELGSVDYHLRRYELTRAAAA